jgi:hypothetical protein
MKNPNLSYKQALIQAKKSYKKRVGGTITLDGLTGSDAIDSNRQLPEASATHIQEPIEGERNVRQRVEAIPQAMAYQNTPSRC